MCKKCGHTSLTIHRTNAYGQQTLERDTDTVFTARVLKLHHLELEYSFKFWIRLPDRCCCTTQIHLQDRR